MKINEGKDLDLIIKVINEDTWPIRLMIIYKSVRAPLEQVDKMFDIVHLLLKDVSSKLDFDVWPDVELEDKTFYLYIRAAENIYCVTLNSNLEVNYSVENETERPEVIRNFLERIMSL